MGMIPIADDNSDRTLTPVVNYLLFAANIAVFVLLQGMGTNDRFTYAFATVPIENVLGHRRYLVFYVVCGVLASLAHVFTTVATQGNTLVPSLGASGAISGVLGGYMLLFPGRRVRVLMGMGTAEMPAWVSIGMWFVFQVVAGVGLLGGGSQAGGVAYAAHVGGFIAGLILVKRFGAGGRTRTGGRRR